MKSHPLLHNAPGRPPPVEGLPRQEIVTPSHASSSGNTNMREETGGRLPSVPPLQRQLLPSLPRLPQLPRQPPPTLVVVLTLPPAPLPQLLLPGRSPLARQHMLQPGERPGVTAAGRCQGGATPVASAALVASTLALVLVPAAVAHAHLQATGNVTTRVPVKVSEAGQAVAVAAAAI